jgi:predicted AAA+ superfamily ATPase
MGGGKTHTMITLGLLAQHPEFRDKVMGKAYKTTFDKKVKVIGFSGRENPKYGIWGYIAEQLGKKEMFKDYYDPLEAPGQSAWINLLKGEPILILLDELPPYFQGAKARQVGDGNLADVTTQALSNLLIAIGKEELKNVALVISDLHARYSDGSAAIDSILEDYAAEVHRVAKDFIPVQQTGDELYHILRTRLFSKLPDNSDIDQIAEEYAKVMKEAKQMDITTESPEKFKIAVKESYPFHPGIKDLYARFKENTGFQQTRGMIRLMRTIVADMFDTKDGWAKNASLISPYDFDLNDSDTQSEIISINNKLTNAISHDIAANGNSVAENLDEQLEGNLATSTAKLILISSLANVPNSVRGLKDVEIVRNLVKPGLDITRIKTDVLTKLQSQSWYLHIDREGNFLYRDIQNVVAKLTSISQSYNKESVRKELMT